MDATQTQRRQVLYRGRVQGVGFRYTARQTAAAFQVAGYVQNLPDGRVRLVVEGQPDELERFLDELRARMARHIRDVEQQTLPATGEFAGFEIRF
jgi:acylphosphatase